MRKLPIVLLLMAAGELGAQADNEIQVYASPTIPHKWTIFELHSNRSLRSDFASSRRINETLEITHGFGKNFEIGFYTFTAFIPGSGFHYLGNQIRPRVTVPASRGWWFGASLSAEFGFFRPFSHSGFIWQGELRPILDKTAGNWYFALNPNIDFVFSGLERGTGISPQVKTVYTIQKLVGIGVEYYSDLGSFKRLLPGRMQEHLLGPMVDLYVHPKWEVNGGFLFGLTRGSEQRIVKLLLGRRVGK